MFNIKIFVIIAIGLVLGIRSFCVNNADYSQTFVGAMFTGISTFVRVSGFMYLIFC